MMFCLIYSLPLEGKVSAKLTDEVFFDLVFGQHIIGLNILYLPSLKYCE